MLLQSLTINGFCLMLNQIQHYHKKSKIERLYTALKSLHYTHTSSQNVIAECLHFSFSFLNSFYSLFSVIDDSIWLVCFSDSIWVRGGRISFLVWGGISFGVFQHISQIHGIKLIYSWLSCIMLLSILEVIVR
jgi:hypothetical protein